jgi:molybdenum-dependent DNA-binding transcriptional regulator ModE
MFGITSCCVIGETDGATLEYMMALLLDEIQRLGSLYQASQAAGIDLDHARERAVNMIESFREPLVEFDKSIINSDNIRLTPLGNDMDNWYWQRFGTVWSSIFKERSENY